MDAITPEINRAISACVSSLPDAYRAGAFRDLEDTWRARAAAPNEQPFRQRSLAAPFEGEWRRLETTWTKRQGFWICSCKVIIHSSSATARMEIVDL